MFSNIHKIPQATLWSRLSTVSTVWIEDRKSKPRLYFTDVSVLPKGYSNQGDARVFPTIFRDVGIKYYLWEGIDDLVVRLSEKLEDENWYFSISLIWLKDDKNNLPLINFTFSFLKVDNVPNFSSYIPPQEFPVDLGIDPATVLCRLFSAQLSLIARLRSIVGD